MSDIAMQMKFLDVANIFLCEMDKVDTAGFYHQEAFNCVFNAVVRIFRGLRGFVDPTPGVCSLDDVNYIAPPNIAKYQLMKDLPKYGNSILSILRTDKAKFWEHAIVQFKSTVGSAEGAAVHFRSVISDLETLEQWTQQDLKALTVADSEKICPTMSRCNTKVMEWMPTLRAGACNAPLRLLRNIVNNVMPHLVDTEVAVKVKVLNFCLVTARILSDAQLVQGIVDIQLNLENAFQSGHVEELVQMMKATTPPNISFRV